MRDEGPAGLSPVFPRGVPTAARPPRRGKGLPPALHGGSAVPQPQDRQPPGPTPTPTDRSRVPVGAAIVVDEGAVRVTLGTDGRSAGRPALRRPRRLVDPLQAPLLARERHQRSGVGGRRAEAEQSMGAPRCRRRGPGAAGRGQSHRRPAPGGPSRRPPPPPQPAARPGAPHAGDRAAAAGEPGGERAATGAQSYGARGGTHRGRGSALRAPGREMGGVLPYAHRPRPPREPPPATARCPRRRSTAPPAAPAGTCRRPRPRAPGSARAPAAELSPGPAPGAQHPFRPQPVPGPPSRRRFGSLFFFF